MTMNGRGEGAGNKDRPVRPGPVRIGILIRPLAARVMGKEARRFDAPGQCPAWFQEDAPPGGAGPAGGKGGRGAHAASDDEITSRSIG